MRVLIVEDDPVVADLFRSCVTELGHVPIVAMNAEAAVSGLRDGPDAILLDLALPDMTGAEFLQHHEIRRRGIPVVAISGVATEGQADEILQLGALDFVRKPLSLNRLAEVVGFLELHVLNRHLVDQVRQLDRRRATRYGVTFGVHGTSYNGEEWDGTALDIGPFGMKVRASAQLDEGAMVKLSFTPPDGAAPMALTAVLVRSEVDGDALLFVNLTAPEFHRLSEITSALSAAKARTG
jgi:CheY-like chemotaxis protein